MDRTWTKGIVVGVDGSAGSTHALDWAADTAVVHGCPLQVLHAYANTVSFVPPPVPLTSTMLKQLGEQVVERSIAHVRDRAPSLREVTGVVRVGSAAHVLVEASRMEQVVVVGRRGLGAFERLALGSVSSAVASRAAGPVAVVSDKDTENGGSVVVGIDSYDTEDAVLEFAHEEARARKLPLKVVHAWEASSSYALLFAEDWTLRDDLAAEVRARVTEALAPWGAKYPDVDTTILVAPGPALDVLLHHAAAADLAVVGGRRHRRALGLLLGSVADVFLRKAPCPVVVVHHATDRH